MEGRICTKCNHWKESLNFGKNKKLKCGLNSWCKACVSIQVQSKVNLEEKRIKSKKYYYDNKEKMNIGALKYYKNNLEKIKLYHKEYSKNKRKTDNLFRLTNNIRNLIRVSFKAKKHNKNSKTSDILGCSIEDFKGYIELKWESWMNWENYGLFNSLEKYGWDLDHIIPISSACSEEEIIQLNHYTNFQPLCSKFNRHIKGKNI